MLKTLISLTVLIRLTLASLTYCSSENTGSSLVNSSIYQSNGLCHDKCNEQGYALAIVQYQDCWCSNYVPEDTTDVDDCNMDCPGFPSEKCGADDLYGYIYLNQPSGTVGSSTTSSSISSSSTPTTTRTSSTSSTSSSSSFIPQTTTSSTSSSISTTPTTSSTWSESATSTTPTTTSTSSTSSTSSSTNSQTSSSTSTSSSSSSSSIPTTSSSSISSSSTIPTTTSSTSSSTTPSTTSSTSPTSSTRPRTTPIITSIIYSISTVTGGQETQYITTELQTTISQDQSNMSTSSDSLARATSDTSTTSTDTATDSKDSFFDSKGKVAGVFTAVGVVGVVILSLLIWLLTKCCLNKRKSDHYDDEDVVGVEGYSRNGDSNKNIHSGGSGNNMALGYPVGYPAVTKTNILNEEEFNENSSTDDTVINEKQLSNSNSMKQKSGTTSAGNVNGNQAGHKRNLSIVSTDFGTPIIDNHGDSTYVDQRLDVGTFSNIHENDEVLSLNDNEDYSRKVLRVTNP